MERKINLRNAKDSSVDMKSDTLPIPRTNAKKNLPEGWEITQLKDICERITKGSTPTSYGYSYTTNGIRFIKAENIDRNGSVSTTTDYIDEETNEYLKRSILRENDILFSIAGTIGRVGLIHEKDLPANTNQALAIIRFHHSAVDTKYLFYYLKSDAIQREAIKRIVGVGRANLSLTEVGELEIALAPPSLQKLIVSEIEKQFSRLDEAVAALKRVRASLKRYKASVLKAAVEGKLTEEWRKENVGAGPRACPDKKGQPQGVAPTETGADLLKRILAERKKKWEEKNPKKKYKEPSAPDTSNLPELPKGWVWINFVRLASDMKNSIKRGPFGSAIKKAFFVQKGYKVYEQQNAIYNNHKLGNYYINEEKYNELIDFTVKPCDFIISCSGTIGKIAQIPESAEKGIINQALLKITIDNKLVLSKYFLYLFKSDVFQKMFLKDIRGTAMKNIASVEDLKLIPVALPPLHEQTTIVEEIESRLSVAEEIEETIDINLKRTERLRQAILKKAFSGKLITQ